MLVRVVTLQANTTVLRLRELCELCVRETRLDGSCQITAPEIRESNDERIRGVPH